LNKKKPEINFDINPRFTASLTVASVLAATYFIMVVYSALCPQALHFSSGFTSIPFGLAALPGSALVKNFNLAALFFLRLTGFHLRFSQWSWHLVFRLNGLRFTFTFFGCPISGLAFPQL